MGVIGYMCQFHQCIFSSVWTDFLSPKKIQIQTVITKKLSKTLSYKKAGLKNVGEIELRSFDFWKCIGHLRRGSQTSGVNFIKVLWAAFVLKDPKSAKKTDNLILFLCFRDLRM